MNNFLAVEQEKYLKAYNDPEFVFYVKTVQKFEYLQVHQFYLGLKKHFPSYLIDYEINPENNTNLFYINSTINDTEYLLPQKEKLEKELESATDWKTKKQLETKLLEIHNELTYGTRGVIVKPFVIDLETGLRTPSMSFPIMLTNNESVMNPDSRDVTDGMARAEVKVGGRFCGYGYRLYTREDIGDSLDDSQKVKLIKAIYKLLGDMSHLEIPDELKVVHFGMTINQLKTIGAELNKLNK